MAEQPVSTGLRSRQLFGVSCGYFVVADLRPWGGATASMAPLAMLWQSRRSAS
jgi:hypothetical protein